MKRYSLSILFSVILFSSLFVSCGKETINYTMIEVAESDQLWTGVAVSNDGRIFVNYPRWVPNIAYSVALLQKNNEVIPYPNEEWNSWDGVKDPKDHFVCVQSVYIDDNGYLWILDTGMFIGRGVIENGTKLIKVDLTSNEVVDKIFFNNEVTLPASYLNDVRIDTQNNFAFITDSGMGALIVVNLDTKQSRRLLGDHPSTKAEDIIISIHGEPWLRPDSTKPQIHSDGIALDKKNEFVYYQALTGHNIYRVPVNMLEDFSIPEQQVETVVEHYIKSGPADGIMFDAENNLFLSSLDESAIRYITGTKKIITTVKGNSLDWPDSFSLTTKGEIYFTDSKLNKAYQPGVKYKIYKLVRE